MSTVKEAMMNQIKSGETKGIENALFVLNQEPVLTREELQEIAKILDYPNDDTQYAALVVLINRHPLEQEIHLKVLNYLSAPVDEIQAIVAKYICDNFSVEDESPQILDPYIVNLVIDRLKKTKFEETVLELLLFIKNYDYEDTEFTETLERFLKDPFSKNVKRLAIRVIAGRKGISNEGVKAVYDLFKTFPSLDMKVITAVVLAQCENTPKAISKEIVDYLEKVDSELCDED